MKIAEALAEADALYENTFSAKQKIAWCDELGALLKNEYAKTYKQEALERENGDYLLPEDITFSEVERFFIQGRACTKKELQRMGYQLWRRSHAAKSSRKPAQFRYGMRQRYIWNNIRR